jgi:hypothetical protein
MRARIAAILLVGLLTSAASVRCESGDPIDGDRDGNPSFATNLMLRDAAGRVRDDFARLEPITFELTVTNRRATPITVQFSSTRQSDFVALDFGTRSIRWKWSDNRAFATVLTEIVFAPGESRTFSATWDQVDRSGQVVPSGRYEARGVLIFPEFDADPTTPHQLGSSLLPFTIR